jgi:hypothetical protein
MTEGRSVTKHGSRGFQGLSRRTHTDRKYFVCVSRKCKRILHSTAYNTKYLHFDSLDQNLLDSTALNTKSFAFRARSLHYNDVPN